MFFKRDKKSKTEVRAITVTCRHCGESKSIDREEIQLMETGYKGRFQAYVTCQKCDADITINEATLPDEIYKYLSKKWFANLVT